MRNINFLGLTDLCPTSPLVVVPPTVVDQSELAKVCELVYAIDERTKLPTGDLNILFSDSVPSDIAEWVRRNLQAPIDVGGTTSIFEGKAVDDDFILKSVRERNESQIEYVNRMDNLLREMFNNKEGN